MGGLTNSAGLQLFYNNSYDGVMMILISIFVFMSMLMNTLKPYQVLKNIYLFLFFSDWRWYWRWWFWSY